MAEMPIDLPDGADALDIALGGAPAGGGIAGLVLLRGPAPSIGDCHPPPIVPGST
jgi:hypothetical protein